MADAQTRKLARQIVDINRRLKGIETTPQLAHTSIDDHGLPVYDQEGNLVAKIGKQDDGTWGAPPLAGPTPPMPTGLQALGGPGTIHVTWTGGFSEGAACPLDFDVLEVLVNGALSGSISNRDGGSVTIASPSGQHYVSARIRTLVPRHSSITSPFAVEVGPPADQLFIDAKEEIDGAKQDIEDAKQEIADERDAREQLAQEVQGTFDELDDRLGEFVNDEALAPIRQALSDAQAAVEAAQGVAETANQAANAASQAALEAAGIAASKGRVIIQETEPQGEDRNAANIWIKPIPDNPDTEIEEKAITYVYLEGSDEWIPTSSDELAQAAQNALDAREAAQQAQQRAETAISNAAAAQAAAQAAQQTADQATLDAADAHNAAVETARRVEEARGSLLNLTPWGGMENPAVGGEPQPPSGWNHHYDPEGSPPGFNAYVETVVSEGQASNVGMDALGDSPVRPGHTYRLTFWLWTNAVSDNLAIGYFPIWRMPDGSRLNSEWGTGYRPSGRSGVLGNVTADPFVSGQWRKVVEDFTPPTRDGVTAVGWIPRMHRWQAGHTGNGADGSSAVGDIWRITGVRLEDVTDLLAAEAAAQAAQDRADEAYDEAARKLDETQVDAKIAASANGKNAITVSTSAPTSSTPGVVVGDTWWRVDGSGQIFGQWRWTGSSWTPVTIRSEVIANLDVHKLRVTGSAKMAEAVIDKLWADGIAAKSITANRLYIGGGSELAVNPYFDNEGAEWRFLNAGPGSSLAAPEAAFPGHATGVLMAPHTSGSAALYGPTCMPSGNDGKLIPVQPGETYEIFAWIRRTEGSVENLSNIHTRAYAYERADGGTLNNTTAGSYMAASDFVPGEWAKVGGTWTVPEGFYYLSPRVTAYVRSGTEWPSDAASWHLGRYSVVKKVGAVLIEDGAIGADKIIADEVAAEVSNLVKARVENLVVTEGATINEAVILKLASEMITAGVLRTAEAGQRVVIDQSGIVMYGVDKDEVEFELVRIGPSGDNLITAGDTTISPAGVQAASGDFGSLSVDGTDLMEILDPLPRGVIARGANNIQGRRAEEGVTELAEMSFDIAPGRAYAVTIEPISMYIGEGAYAHLNVHWTASSDGSVPPAPTMSDPVVRRISGRNVGSAGLNIFGGTFYIQTGTTSYIRMLFTLTTTNGAATIYNSSLGGTFRAFIQDVGLTVPDVMIDRSGTTAAPKPPPPAKKTYTKTYTSTSFHTYDNNTNETSDPDVVQGLYAGGPSRLRRRGGWKFPSFTNDLSGATVEKVEMYIYLNHSYYTAGATVNPATHNGNISNSLTAFTSVYNWKRNTGKWITLPKSLYNGFKNGTYQGVGVVSTNSTAEQYARFNGSGAKIRITYVK